jgi:prenyl protein peptidase
MSFHAGRTDLSDLIAHAHHAYEQYVLGGRSRSSLQQGILQAREPVNTVSYVTVLISNIFHCTVFQTFYTTLFGWHASFLYLRTASLLPPILSHIFCNIMGFPQLGEQLHNFPRRKWSELQIQ